MLLNRPKPPDIVWAVWAIVSAAYLAARTVRAQIKMRRD
jgi:hypothetical protein